MLIAVVLQRCYEERSLDTYSVTHVGWSDAAALHLATGMRMTTVRFTLHSVEYLRMVMKDLCCAVRIRLIRL